MSDRLDFDDIMRVQRQMASRIVEEQQTDNKIKVMSIINELTTGKTKNIQKEAVLIEAQGQGLTESQVDDLLVDLEKDNFLVQKAGYIRKV